MEATSEGVEIGQDVSDSSEEGLSSADDVSRCQELVTDVLHVSFAFSLQNLHNFFKLTSLALMYSSCCCRKSFMHGGLL